MLNCKSLSRQKHLSIIKDADKAYYELDNPLYSDEDYDNIRREYIDRYGEADLNYVPGAVSAGFERFKHTSPVSSLDKVKETEKTKLMERIKAFKISVMEPKFDGLTVVAYPNPDGKTCKFVTRGSGEEGEVLPNFISEYEGECCNNLMYPIRGEVYLTDNAFEEINDSRPENEKFVNARNAAAGILRNIERSQYIDKLSFTVYDVIGLDLNEDHKIDYIKTHTNFDAVIPIPVDNEADTDSIIESLNNLYFEYRYNKIPVDGVVVKCNRDGSLNEFGFTGHHPKNAFAFKRTTEMYHTKLRNITWQLGKKYLTPVAEFDPIVIDGCTVSRATFHNANIVESFGPCIGDTLLVTKANEIIPEIFEVTHNHEGEKIELPKKCPYCGAELASNNKQLFCPNNKCDEKIAQKMSYICTKKILDIKGMSIETCRKIYKYLCDRYPNTKAYYNEFTFLGVRLDDLKNIPGFADKSARKLYDNIQTARQNTDLAHFIAALCIPNIGLTIGNAIMDKYKTDEKFRDELCHKRVKEEDKYKEIISIKGIGDVAAKSIINLDFVDRYSKLSAYIPNIKGITEDKNKKKNSDVLNFVLTGKMEHPRSYYEDLIKSSGHNVQSSVNNKTNYLVIADVNSLSTKATKARSLGTMLISPKDLENMLTKNN